ncbi:MAG: carboxymuconolactone decarboxylase family protein, partial [Burkholderiaceae bacterium]|nr:carboxymuconolactone decarboxylase family protein [Burkholderiaceae bacterium]
MTVRFPPIPAAKMSEPQRALAAEYRSVWRGKWMPADGRLGGPLDALIRTPEVAACVSSLGDIFKARTTLPAPVKSMAVLMAALSQRSGFMWEAHVEAALESGLSNETVSWIASGERPGSLGPKEAAAYDLLTEISRTKQVTDECF